MTRTEPFARRFDLDCRGHREAWRPVIAGRDQPDGAAVHGTEGCMNRNDMTRRRTGTTSTPDVDIAPPPGQPRQNLPKRAVGRSIYPEPVRPVATAHDPVLLHAVLDGLRRTDAEVATP